MKVTGTYEQSDSGPVLQSVTLWKGVYNNVELNPGEIREAILQLERYLPGAVSNPTPPPAPPTPPPAPPRPSFLRRIFG
jgi:hypothetical protein